LTLQRRGDEAQVHYGPRTWPVRGNAEIVAVIESRRDTCKYIHDQALRQANKGYTPAEGGRDDQAARRTGTQVAQHGYHGTLHHDVRAVCTKELGTRDGDPVSLHPHPPAESAKHYVDLINAARIMEEGRRAFDTADYRRAAESCTSWCSPSRTTRPPASCRPAPTSR
jgi:alkyl sulfatase BDS1-like metallo-beta-lactamase superfamily hydrolase